MTIAVLQEVTAYSNPAVASVSVNLTVQPGNLLHVWATCLATSVVTVADNKNGTYGAAMNNVAVGGSKRVAQFRFEQSKGGLITVTASFAANSAGGIWVAEISGALAPAAFDASAGQSQVAPGLGANAVTSGNAVSSKQPALVIGLSADVVQGGQLATGTGFTSTTTGWNDGSGNIARSENKRVTATGNQAATFTALANDTFITLVAVYDEGIAPVAATVTQTNGGSNPFEASRLDSTIDPATGLRVYQTTQIGTFVSAADAMAAVNQQLNRVLAWTQDVRIDGVTSFTGR